MTQKPATPSQLAPPMGSPLDLVVAALPVLGVEAGHVAEARRALQAQGRAERDDDAIVRLLWVARALPAALDALDARDADDAVVCLGAATVTVAADAAGSGPLVAVARVAEEEVVVEIVEHKALFAAGDDDPPAPALCVIAFSLESKRHGDEMDGGEGEIAVRRFTIGPP